MCAKSVKKPDELSENMDLKTREEKFRFMFERSSVGKSFTLPSGEINVNQTFCNMLGYSQNELQNKSWQEITHPEDITLTQNALNKVLSGEQDVVRFEKRYLHKNGDVIWADVSTVLLRGQSDAPLYFMTEVNDITVRKQAEDALRESEEHYKLIFESSPLAINITRGTEIAYANPSYLKMFGFSNLDEVKSIAPLELFTPEYRPKILDNIKNRANGLPVPNSYEAECFRKDGSRFPILMYLTRAKFIDGLATLGFIIDTTERKQAEQEMALRLGFEMLLAEIQANFLAIPTEEVDQAILSAQRKLCEYFGTDRSALWQGSADEPENLRMTHLCTLDEIPPVPEGVTTNTLFPWFTRQLLAMQIVAVPDVHALPSEAATDSKNLIYYGDKSTLAIPFSSGEPPVFGALSFAATAQPTRWSEAILAHCRLVAQVFSGVLARKQIEDDVRKLNAELEVRVEARTHELHEAQEKLIQQERLAVLGRLSGGVSQELRNPLGIINNAIYYLRIMQPEADMKIKEYLDIIESEAYNADKIVSDLLDFSSNELVDREPIAVSELVGDALQHFPIPENVQVTLNLPENLPKVYLDPHQITQALGNLIVNACQAMNDGGRLTVDGRQLTADGQSSVVIAVKDTGTGILPKNMQRLFEPLFTTKPKGIGLGLAVSQKLVEANGGRIEVESEVGKGSTFTVWLPVHSVIARVE